jgi:hypothetical protein
MESSAHMKRFSFVTVIIGILLLAASPGSVIAGARPAQQGGGVEIKALSPNSSEQGGTGFVLSVVGKNFTSASAVLIEAWNEFGEGSHMLPTDGDGFSYGDAIGQMLLKKPE